MNKEYLEKNAKKIGEIDFHDALYHCAYGGTNTYYYLDGFVYMHVYYSNKMSYMGKSQTFPYMTLDDLIAEERDNAANVMFYDMELLDLLEEFARKEEIKINE